MADPHPTVSPPSSTSALLYTILPTAVRTHWLRLSRFRRSLSRSKNCLEDSSAAASPERRNSRSSGLQRGFVRDGSVSSSPSRSPSPPYQRAPARGQNGPEWKYATQGLTLLSTAISEAQAAPALSRQLYIHALIYLLQALPADLTGPETSGLGTALPTPLRVHLEPSSPAQVPASSSSSSSPPPRHRRPLPSLLHRVLASTIVQLFLLVQVLAPYVKCLLRRAYRYERTHRVTERAVVSGIEAADALGRKAAGVASVVLWTGDGRVAELLVGGVGWWVDGICGGVQEGVGVGMTMIGEGRERG